MATFAASLISGVQEISLISLIGEYCANIFEQNSQIIAKIEMSSKAIVSNNQRSLPTWFYVRLCLMYENNFFKFNVPTKNLVPTSHLREDIFRSFAH
jgi:hypothetical protein